MDSLVPWEEDNLGSPWHPRRYRHHAPLGVFDEARKMEKEMDRMTKNMRNMMSSMERRAFGQHWDLNERPFDFISPALEHRVEGDEMHPGKYKMSVPLGRHIGPHDLKVSCKDNVMTIEAKKDRESEDGSCKVHQEFKRTFTLPQNVDMMEVKSVLTPDGCLEIEAPLPVPAITEAASKPMEIPIERT